MRTIHSAVAYRLPAFSLATILLLLIFSTGCKKNDVPNQNNPNKKIGHFKQVNLVANTDGYNAAHIDANLVNGWGLAFNPTGIAWVNAEDSHVSNIYNAEGTMLFGPVHIPDPNGGSEGTPSGIVFNPNDNEFMISGGAARFIFAGTDGVISAWNQSLGVTAVKVAAVSGAAYTGLTLATNAGNTYLYAANFAANKVEVWDKDWNVVNFSFSDPNIPAGFAPFNIQKVADWLFVTYAKVGDDGDEERGAGLGYVDIYKTDGTLVTRLASQGTLNAPWGVAMAPSSFFKDEDDNGKAKKDVILVGNFGDGRINAFRIDGKFLGQLREHNNALTIDGLWAIMFPPSTSNIDPNRLYFAAGPKDEEDGLFGYVIPDKENEND